MPSITMRALGSYVTSNIAASELTAVLTGAPGIGTSRNWDSRDSRCDCVQCELAMKTYGEPDVGNLLVRFDED
jgi:hypothetical protein